MRDLARLSTATLLELVRDAADERMTTESEAGRRRAGDRLVDLLDELDRRGESWRTRTSPTVARPRTTRDLPLSR